MCHISIIHCSKLYRSGLLDELVRLHIYVLRVQILSGPLSSFTSLSTYWRGQYSQPSIMPNRHETDYFKKWHTRETISETGINSLKSTISFSWSIRKNVGILLYIYCICLKNGITLRELPFHVYKKSFPICLGTIHHRHGVCLYSREATEIRQRKASESP